MTVVLKGDPGLDTWDFGEFSAASELIRTIQTDAASVVFEQIERDAWAMFDMKGKLRVHLDEGSGLFLEIDLLRAAECSESMLMERDEVEALMHFFRQAADKLEARLDAI